MIVKKHKTPDGRLVLAICDSEIIGKKFVQGKMQIDLGSDFYKGDEMDEEKTAGLIKFAYIINMAGEKAVNIGIKGGIVEKKGVIKICNVPHAESVIVRDE